jgi:hypothetical protein
MDCTTLRNLVPSWCKVYIHWPPPQHVFKGLIVLIRQQHWVGFYLKGNTVYIMDSQQTNQTYDLYHEWLGAHYDIVTLPRIIQPQGTKTCGLFCVLFIHHMGADYPFTAFVNKFPNITTNEHVLFQLFKSFNGLK